MKRLVGEQLPRKPASVRQVEIDRPDPVAHARLGDAAGLRLLIAGMRHGNLRQTVPQGSMCGAYPAVVDDAGQPRHYGVEIDPAVHLGSGGKAGRLLIGGVLACAPACHHQGDPPFEHDSFSGNAEKGRVVAKQAAEGDEDCGRIVRSRRRWLPRAAGKRGMQADGR